MDNTAGPKDLERSEVRISAPDVLRFSNGVRKQKDQADICQSGPRRTAAAYSPTWWGSTIGDGGLNFSVRNGKRWFPAAIATAIYYLRETTRQISIRFAYNFQRLIFLLRKDLGLLVQVD